MNRIVFYLLFLFFVVTDTIAQGKMFKEESDGFKWYSIWTDDNKFSGALDVYGNDIIPLYKYRYVSYDNNNGVFLVIINDDDLQNGKFGYCTRRGWIIINPEQVDKSFIVETDGTKYIKISKQDKYGAYSLEGKVIVPCEYDDCGLYSLQVSSPRQGRLQYFCVKKGGKEGVYDLNGKLVIPVNYNEIRYNDWDDSYRGFEGKQGNDISYRKLNISIPVTYSVSEIRKMYNDAYKSQDVKTQYNLYNQIILNDPYNIAGLNSYVYNNLGVLYENNSDLKNAKNCYQNAINIYPQNTIANENLKNVKSSIRKERLDRVVNIFGYLSQAWGEMSGVQTNGTYNTSQGDGGSYSGSSGGSFSGERTCPSCGGSGKCSTQGWADKYRCHGSGRCQHCNNTGTQRDYGYTRVCSTCNGTKKCHYCGGSGRCSTCGGSGKR